MPSSARSRRTATTSEDSVRDSSMSTSMGMGMGLAEIRSPISLPSPASAASPSPSSSHFFSSSLNPSRLLRRRRNWSSQYRALGGGSAIFIVLWLVLVFLGAFDSDLQIGPHIDTRTFQVLPHGDPQRSKEPEYERPPDYWQYLANWNKPSYELLANAPPSHRTCDKSGPLIFIGIFTHPPGVGRRQIIRTVFEPDLHPEGHKIVYKFIVGRPADDDWRYLLEQENKSYGDIEILEDVVKDNIDEGKTVDYFKWLAKGLPDPKPQFILKMDDDTFLVMPNVIRNLSSLDCSKAIYWGTTQGANEVMFGKYMRGLCYGMSWPLASWVGTSNVTAEYAVGIEDARMGRMVQHLDPKTEPVQWVDHGWKMGDWDQLTVNEELIAFHWLKLDHWVPMVKRKALKAFADAGRAYRWDWEKHPIAKQVQSIDDSPLVQKEAKMEKLKEEEDADIP